MGTREKRLKGRAREDYERRRKRNKFLGIGAGAAALAAIGLALSLLVPFSGSLGGPAPAWQARSIDGENLSSDSLKGDVYVLDFFFTWCPICARQFPAKAALVDEFRDRDDFHFISVDADPSDSPATIDQYRSERGATWPFVADKYGLYQKFKVDSRPFIVFVDRNGTIDQVFRRLTPARDLIDEARALLDAPVGAADPEAAAANGKPDRDSVPRAALPAVFSGSGPALGGGLALGSTYPAVRHRSGSLRSATCRPVRPYAVFG